MAKKIDWLRIIANITVVEWEAMSGTYVSLNVIHVSLVRFSQINSFLKPKKTLEGSEIIEVPGKLGANY